MKPFQSFAAKQPVLFVLGSIIAWLVVGMVLAGIASTALGWPYEEALTIGRLVATAGCLVLLWQLGWLKVSGVRRSGSWPVWLIALVGMVYFAGANTTPCAPVN
jgi:hypothetical protein